jgi:hypothetical protein
MPIALDTPQDQAPQQQPGAGIGAMLGGGQAQANDAQERKRNFLTEVMRTQKQLETLARMEPGFAEAARKAGEIISTGMGKVVGSMPDVESSQTPYL